MFNLRRIISRESGPFWQFVKYGAIGVMSTIVQLCVFYALASTCLKCLTADDIAVKYLGLKSAYFSGQEPWYFSRGMIASAATAIGFTISNIFCWLMNRAFVFMPGKFRWWAEFGMFYGAATFATVVALGIMTLLIDLFGVTTSFAAFVEVAVSFLVNFFVRKFFIFKG